MKQIEKRKTDNPSRLWTRGLLSAALLALAIRAGVDIHQSAGHGAFLGHFDKIWGAIFVGFVLFSLVFLVIMLAALWLPVKTSGAIQAFDRIRKIGWLKWAVTIFILCLPAWILLYTDYGFDLTGLPIRLYLFVITTFIGGWFLTREEDQLLSWLGLIQSVIVFGAIFMLAKAVVTVTNFPLSLSWSEGNRIWDYSVLFGRDLYIYPPEKAMKAYIDSGRQSLWGLPFLLPAVTIAQVRLWSALVFTVPYALFGWVIFRTPEIKSKGWVLAGLWVMLFLNQGPIYTPLVLAAILVALPRRWPWWIGLPIIFGAGYYAQMSRLTWMFAPGIWAAMMAINDYPLALSKEKFRNWILVAAYGGAGFMGGFGVSGWKRLRSYLGDIGTSVPDVSPTDPAAVQEAVQNATQQGGNLITDQALLWSRLLPNPTYPEGVLIGLALAILPLMILLVYLVVSKRWALNRWQILGLSLPLMAFLAVGIVISVKIGGGSNLHNLDMLLVALVFVAAFAWERGGFTLLDQIGAEKLGLQILVLLLVAIPAFYPMIDARPLELPSAEKAALTVDIIQQESDRVVSQGKEVLFMDQRQLLTFGFVEGIPLVADYEKKKVMDLAMSGDQEYFDEFYRDLADHRFGLIITEPQNIRYATADDDWAEENDVWVEWVTKPLLCYYEPQYDLKRTSVWLLVPRAEALDCVYP